MERFISAHSFSVRSMMVDGLGAEEALAAVLGACGSWSRVCSQEVE